MCKSFFSWSRRYSPPHPSLRSTGRTGTRTQVRVRPHSTWCGRPTRRVKRYPRLCTGPMNSDVFRPGTFTFQSKDLCCHELLSHLDTLDSSSRYFSPTVLASEDGSLSSREGPTPPGRVVGDAVMVTYETLTGSTTVLFRGFLRRRRRGVG